MKIAINGSLGSGKSTVAKKLAEEMGWTYLSTGARFRAMAKERGMDLGAFSEMAEKDPGIDQAVDDWLRSFNDSEKNLIIDSRMAPFFIQDALKIRLKVSDSEGARRIFSDTTRGEEESFSAIEEAEKAYRLRSRSEVTRYFDKYGVDVEDETQYDLVIDTSQLTVQQVCDRIQQRLLDHAPQAKIQEL